MRIVIAALLGAIVIFFWQFLSHMVLPIGEMGFRLPQSEQAEDAVLQAASPNNFPTAGIYYLPSVDPKKMGDEAVMKTWAEKAAKNPWVFMVVNPPKADPMSMTPHLVKQFITNFLAALIAAFVLAATPWTLGMRVVGAGAFGIFGWLADLVPQWTWYRFPADFIVGGLIDQGVGWLLAGVAIAWWLGRR